MEAYSACFRKQSYGGITVFFNFIFNENNALYDLFNTPNRTQNLQYKHMDNKSTEALECAKK